MAGKGRVIQTESVAQRIEELLRARQWGNGELLPSLRDLSTTYNVSHETVRRALQRLERRGLVRKVHGSGTVVSDPLPAAAPTMAPADGRALALLERPRRRRLTTSTCEYNSEKRAFWDAAAAAFRSAHPGVDLHFTRADLSALQPRTQAFPDIVHGAWWELKDLGRRGLLLNLRNSADSTPALRSRLIGADCPLDDDPCWAIPVAFDAYVTFVDREKVGLAELERLRRIWRAPSAAEWDLEAMPSILFPRPHILLSLFGVDVMSYAPSDGSSQRLAGALAVLKRWDGRRPIYAPDALSHDLCGRNHDAFCAGEAAVAFQHTFMICRTLGEAGFPWDVLPMPVPARSPLRCYLLCCAISRHSHAPEEAWQFISFLAGSEGQRLLAQAKNNVPVSPAALRSPEFTAAPPGGLDQLAGTLGEIKDWTSVGSDGFVKSYVAVWDEETLGVLQGRHSPDEAVRRIWRRCSALRGMYEIEEEVK